MNKVASPPVVLPLTSAYGARVPWTTLETSMNSDDGQVLKVCICCAVCGIEVPLDEAVVPEATDELIYLCGLDCYARWRATAAISFPSLPPKPD